jgi:hypothetical protein
MNRADSSCRLIMILKKSSRRQFLLDLLSTKCRENAGSFLLGVTGR